MGNLHTKKQKETFLVLYVMLMEQLGREPSPEVVREYV